MVGTSLCLSLQNKHDMNSFSRSTEPLQLKHLPVQSITTLNKTVLTSGDVGSLSSCFFPSFFLTSPGLQECFCSVVHRGVECSLRHASKATNCPSKIRALNTCLFALLSQRSGPPPLDPAQSSLIEKTLVLVCGFFEGFVARASSRRNSHGL